MISLINIIEWPYSYLIEFNVYCNNPYLTKSGPSLMRVKMGVIESKHERILQNLAGIVVCPWQALSDLHVVMKSCYSLLPQEQHHSACETRRSEERRVSHADVCM